MEILFCNDDAGFEICHIRELRNLGLRTSGTTLLLELGFRTIVAVPRLTRLTFRTNCSNSEVDDASLSLSSKSVSGSTSIVTGPSTPEEAVETALEGFDIELLTSSDCGDAGIGIRGSTLKKGIGSI